MCVSVLLCISELSLWRRPTSSLWQIDTKKYYLLPHPSPHVHLLHFNILGVNHCSCSFFRPSSFLPASHKITNLFFFTPERFQWKFIFGFLRVFQCCIIKKCSSSYMFGFLWMGRFFSTQVSFQELFRNWLFKGKKIIGIYIMIIYINLIKSSLLHFSLSILIC